MLAAVGVAQAMRLSLQSRYAARTEDRQQAWFLAETAVQTACQRLSKDDFAGPAQPVTFGSGSFRYTVEDEQALLPLNSIPKEYLRQLPGFSPEAAEALRGPEAKPIAHLGELRALAGYNAAALEELVPLVTVHGTGPVNLNTAPLPVLRSLGFSESFAAVVSDFRNGADGQFGTPDDGFFKDLEAIAQKLLNPANPLLSPEDARLLRDFLPMLGVASSLFRVAGEGRVTRSGVTARVTAIVDRNGTIWGWHED